MAALHGLDRKADGSGGGDPMSHGCNGCDASWSGFNIAHCAACHKTFGGVSGFDKHRAGSKDKTRRAGECSDPAEIGLVLNAHGTWVTPSDGADFGEIFSKPSVAAVRG